MEATEPSCEVNVKTADGEEEVTERGKRRTYCCGYTMKEHSGLIHTCSCLAVSKFWHSLASWFLGITTRMRLRLPLSIRELLSLPKLTSIVRLSQCDCHARTWLALGIYDLRVQ